jgi:hypothetical protein
MIPPASEFKTKLDAKRAILVAADGTANPRLARHILFNLLRSLEEELERALMDPDLAPASVQVRVDPAILGNPALLQVRTFLLNLGYTVTANVAGGLVTISW